MTAAVVPRPGADEIVKWEGLPWGKTEAKTVPTSASAKFACASTVKPDGKEVFALFNYDSEESIRVDLAGTACELKPYETRFVER